MIVILTKDVKGTGKAGEVVKVSDGFARNMLLPKGLAKEATEGNIRNLEKQKQIMAEKEAESRAAAEAAADRLGKVTVQIVTKSGEGGRLFGSITSKDIAGALQEQFGIEVDKKKIELDSPIKETGLKEVVVRLYPEVQAKMKVNVVTE
ncbi:MAG: 50S ribosomal protein L9 [Eubacteriaceae bacterium]|jgi:large subunit ribosomal protein L9|nr:50S ribosomal protein L9 [Eubacteriaceae bacterium]